MIPRLSHFVQKDGVSYFVTSDGVVGLTLLLQFIDEESSRAHEKKENLRQWLKLLPTEVLVRFHRSTADGNSEEIQSSRKEDFSKLGFLKHNLSLTLEYQGSAGLGRTVKTFLGLERVSVEQKVLVLSGCIQRLREMSFEAKTHSEEEIREVFFWSRHYGFRVRAAHLELGSKVLGCLRLKRQTPEAIDVSRLGRVAVRIPAPFQVSVSLQRVEPVRREMILRRRLKQQASASDSLSKLQTEATEGALKETFLEGAELFEFEFLVVVPAESEERLREKLRLTQDALSGLGDISIETYGCLPSFTAQHLGSSQHVPLFELDEALLGFLPVQTPGEAGSLSDSSLVLQRVDQGLCGVDLFSRDVLNSNFIIVGASGRGKSVLTGLLTESLLSHPKVRMIKVDVGGSHSRECELWRGQEHRLSLNEPTCLNPFSMIGDERSEDIRAILGRFLEVLVLEEGEVKLPKMVRAEIDELLKEYLSSATRSLDLQGFYESSSGFSRTKLLRRWCTGGLYEKAFSSQGKSLPDSRLTYFNFSEIFQAADPEFTQAVMAAVIAKFNLELSRYPEHRLVFICDETPFFIEKCFEIFKFSMANVRKFGAAVGLTVQQSRQLVMKGDTSLIDNAHQRFLFSVDGDEDDYRKRFRLSERELCEIQNLETRPRLKSEALYQAGEESKKVIIRLSSEEYWKHTSSHLEKMKFREIAENMPSLTPQEILKILALTV